MCFAKHTEISPSKVKVSRSRFLTFFYDAILLSSRVEQDSMYDGLCLIYFLDKTDLMRRTTDFRHAYSELFAKKWLFQIIETIYIYIYILF